MSESATVEPKGKIILTVQAELARQKALGRIYRKLLREASAKQDEANRLREIAQSVYLLMDGQLESCDTMLAKSEAQVRRDAARALRGMSKGLESVAANLDEDAA